MEEFVLNAKRRDVIGKKVKVLRQEGILPGVIYGRKIEPVPISLDHKEASQILGSMALTSLINIEVDDETYPSLVRERQRDVIRGTLLHVDFMVVSLEDTLRTNVVVEIAGESPVVKEFSALLVTGANQLEIECLPTDLPESIVVDVSGLEGFGDGIYVRDLVLPGGVTVLDDPDTMLVVVSAQAEIEEEVVEEEEELLEEMELEEPEVIEHGRKEEGSDE
jgi:large subunit ribosomal protein L25